MSNHHQSPPSSPIAIIGSKAFAATDFINPENSPELVAHMEAWEKKMEKRFVRSEKREMIKNGQRFAHAHFFTYVRHIRYTKPGFFQRDICLQAFAEFVEKTTGLPRSSDPRVLVKHHYAKLNEEQTIGFQRFMVCYREKHFLHMLPKELAGDDRQPLIDVLQLIVTLQKQNPV